MVTSINDEWIGLPKIKTIFLFNSFLRQQIISSKKNENLTINTVLLQEATSTKVLSEGHVFL